MTDLHRMLPLGLLFLAATSHAQQSVGSARTGTAMEAPPVIVTGNPLGSDLVDLASPADVLSGPTLRARLDSTLGETLSSQTGVSSSYFGPNSSRPVIRGLDGERVRILQNGTASLDASGASPDHGTAIEPLTLDRIEIVRGPAALLYGGSAIGGVVNAIDNRIAQAPPDRPFSGAAQIRLGGAADERAGVARLAGGTDRFALHVDTFRRDTSDLRIPGMARSARLQAADPLAPPDTEATKRLPNSASTSDGVGVGGTAFFDRGYVGAAVTNYNSNYGTVAERDVTIDMKQTRYDLAGELRDLGFLDNAKFRIGHTTYRHTEFEGPDPGTNFRNTGYDARLDLRHKPLGRFDGAFGFQVYESRFSAVGAESFVPPVRTRSLAAFVYEETTLGSLKLSAGGRLDRVHLDAQEYLPNFSPAESRSFIPKSGSLGAVITLAPEYSVAANLSLTERAPNYAEIFANGPHAATGQFEIGSRSQKIERALAFDLGLRKRGGAVTGSVGVFAQRFTNFIGLLPTGLVDAGSGLPVFRFEGVKADFRGVEADARFHLVDRGDHNIHLDLRTDYTRAQNDSSGEPLPRISPLRFSAAVSAQKGPTSVRVEAIRAAAQNRTAPDELATDGYTLVNARVTHLILKEGQAELELFLRASNLLNQEIRIHTSLLKDLAPLGGRSVMVGVNGTF